MEDVCSLKFLLSQLKDSQLKTMAFRRHQALASILLFFYIRLASAASSGNATWCMTEDSYDPYGVALTYLGVQTIQEPQLDQLIQDVFGRLGCQQIAFEDNVTCENVRQLRHCNRNCNFKVIERHVRRGSSGKIFTFCSTLYFNYLSSTLLPSLLPILLSN